MNFLGPVKKCGLLKILHEKYAAGTVKSGPPPETKEFRFLLQEVAETTKEIQPYMNKAQENLNPLRVLNLFRNIPDVVRGSSCNLLKIL